MYEEVSDEVAVASDAYADVGVSGSGYYSATDDYNSGGISSSSETLNNSVNSTILNNGVKEEPEFLRQDRLQKAAIEAARTKASFMTYRESPMFRRMSEGFEEATGSWNERFQALIDMEDSFEKYDKLRSTAHDFVHAAEAYGRIIISEMCLDDQLKTIKPMALGGVAGGQKFIVQDILFKFAVDFEGLYGGDAFAMKGAGHDLAGLMAYLGAIEVRPRGLRVLHVPLMALIDFRGYRLVAICVLPINRASICYGSYDAGKTVHSKFPVCNAAMKEIGEHLNIMGHRSNLNENIIYAPVDIEAHLGKDNKFYVLDFARYMPPQPPSGKWGGTLYELLRPELVKLSPTPLNPDAFSTMGHTSDAKESRQAIRDVFQLLVKPGEGGIIYDYAKLLDSEAQSASEISELTLKGCTASTAMALMEVLVRELHSRGINMRFLGLLRSFCTGPNIRMFLLSECLGRLWKMELRHLWRDVMRSEKSPSAEPFRKITSRYFNMILGDRAYWAELKVKLEEKFPGVLSAEEKAPEFELQTVPVCHRAFWRLLQVVSVELDKATMASLDLAFKGGLEELRSLEFVAGDIVQMGCRIKHMSTVDKADAYAYMYQSTSLSKKNPGTSKRLLGLSLTKLLTAMKTSGTDLELQFKFCVCRIEMYKSASVSKSFSAEKAVATGLAEDALSALTKKLEEQKSPMLPSVLLLKARFAMLKVKGEHESEEMVVSAIKAASEALAKYKEDLSAFLVDADEQVNFDANLGLLPYLYRTCKALVAVVKFVSGNQSHRFELIRNYDYLFVQLFDDFFPMFNSPKIFAANPVVGVWMWWLLFQHTRVMSSQNVVQSVTAKMVEDANSFVVRAMDRDPRLKTTFLDLLRAKTIAELSPYLPAAEQSQEVFDALYSLSAPWTTWRCVTGGGPHHPYPTKVVPTHISSPVTFTRLCCVSPNLTRLKMEGFEPFPSDMLLTILGSSLRNTLEVFGMPRQYADCSFLLQLKEVFPKLKRLTLRNLPVTDVEIIHWVALCPVLEKLDISMTFASPEGLVNRLPDTIKKLDLGFPRESWQPSSLSLLLRCKNLASLTFLGLAGTSVCDAHLSEIFASLPHLMSLDLAKTVVSERYLRLVMHSPSFTASMREVWLPRGIWYPLCSEDEVITVRNVPSVATKKATMFVRDKEACVFIRTHAGVMVNPREGDYYAYRGLHLERLGRTFFLRQSSLNDPLNVLFQDNVSLTWCPGETFMDRSKKGALVLPPGTLAINNNTARQNPLAASMIRLQNVYFEGEYFFVTITAAMNKVTSINIERTLTKEKRTVRIHPGSMKILTFQPFTGVNPMLFMVVVQALAAMNPVVMDGVSV